MKKTWAEWKTYEIVEQGDTFERVWTDTHVLYRVVRIGDDLYYVEHIPRERDEYVLEGRIVTRSTAPVWRYVDNGTVALLAEEPTA